MVTHRIHLFKEEKYSSDTLYMYLFYSHIKIALTLLNMYYITIMIKSWICILHITDTKLI